MKTQGRALKRRKTVVDDEDEFSQNSEADAFADGMIIHVNLKTI